MKRKIYLFRHTQSYDNFHNVFSGDRRDVGLTEKGREDAYKMKEFFVNKEIGIGISSPLQRSIETLEIILEGHGSVERIIDDRIRERDYGILEGRHKKDMLMPVLRTWAKFAHRSYWFPPPGGENFIMVWNRVMPFVDDIIELVKTQDTNLAICAHNNSMRPIRAYFEKKSPRQILQENSEHGKVYIYNIEI